MHQMVKPEADTSRRWWVLATVVAAQFMFGVDAFIVNVAIPTIASELNASAAQIEAVIAIYLIVAGITGLLYIGLIKAPSLSLAEPLVLPSVPAAVIGGTSIFGGRGGYRPDFDGGAFFDQPVEVDARVVLKAGGGRKIVDDQQDGGPVGAAGATPDRAVASVGSRPCPTPRANITSSTTLNSRPPRSTGRR